MDEGGSRLKEQDSKDVNGMPDEAAKRSVIYEKSRRPPGEDQLGEAGIQYAYRQREQGEYTLEDCYQSFCLCSSSVIKPLNSRLF